VGRRKEYPVLEKIVITDIGSEGNALARYENQVIFVPMLVPGDIVDLRVIRKRKKYLEAVPVRFHEYSDLRTEPVCSHFGTCGGCRWQHIPYDKQLKFKEKQVVDNLTRIGKVDLPENEPIIGSPEIFNYRNKLEFTFSDRRWLTVEEMNSSDDFGKEDALGFHIPGFFDKVLDINRCYLQPEPSNAIRDSVKRFARKSGFRFFNLREQTGFLRNLIIRNTSHGEVMVIVVFFMDEQKRREELLDYIWKEFPGIKSLMYIINSKRNDSLSDQHPVLYRGTDHLTEEMDGLKFRIGPKSFFQTNSSQAINLYRKVLEYCGLTGREIVYDLYTGTGTIANFVARNAGSVVGIEYISEAVEDAVRNSELNGIRNTKFFSGDIKQILTREFIFENGSPDIIITDPPRAGMHEDIIDVINDTLPEKIVYVSCNPSTQARDLALLSDNYSVAKVQPVDMFPHTHHVENILLLIRKTGTGE